MVLLAVPLVWLFVARRWYRLPSTPARPAPLPPLIALLLLALMVPLGLLGESLAAQVWGIGVLGEDPMTTEDQAKRALGRYTAQMIAVLVFLVVGMRPAGRGRGRAALLGVGALALWWPVTVASGFAVGLVLTALGHAPQRVAHETLRLLLAGDEGPWPIVLALLVVLATPVVEEVMYRGLLQGAMRRLGLSPWVAIVGTSALFALMHWSAVEPNAVVALFVLSLGFGWTYEKSGRLMAPIVMHALFNAGNLALAFLSA